MAEAAEDPADFGQQSTDQPGQSADNDGSSKKRNAFAELMAPRSKLSKLGQTAKKVVRWRGALVEYIDHPEHFPQSVLRVTDNTVLIKDSFPKATIHLLLLPRSPAHYDLHPHEAFEDPTFLAMMKEEAASAAKLVAAELERQLSPFSAQSKARNDAMAAGVPYDQLPAGRDFLSEIRIGIHAHPSMSHLHVHILSRDMHSDKVKHQKHYNSFNTPFFIPLADYPLAEDDERRKTSVQNANLKKGFVCWRCGQNFGNKFTQLKAHLEVEFEEWKKE